MLAAQLGVEKTDGQQFPREAAIRFLRVQFPPSHEIHFLEDYGGIAGQLDEIHQLVAVERRQVKPYEPVRIVDADLAFHGALCLAQLRQQRPLQLDQLLLAPQMGKHVGKGYGLAAAEQGRTFGAEVVALDREGPGFVGQREASFNRPQSSFMPSDRSRWATEASRPAAMLSTDCSFWWMGVWRRW